MRNYILGVLIILLAGACNTSKYDVDNYLDGAIQDSVMTDIITYIYKVPKGADSKRKHELEYRKLYVSQLDQFQWVYYQIDKTDSTHYFYLTRPAKNTTGSRRGVLGKFKLGPDHTLQDFEEIANTPMLPEEELLEKGGFLWKDLMHYKSVDRYHLNKAYIEFPDERIRYDAIRHEWTYEKE